MERTASGHAASRWSALDMKRQTVLKRCRTCASLTLPFLLPPEGTTEDDQLPTPYQSVGARAVNNLASKLILTLYPPNSPYFKMELDQAFLEKLKEQTQDKEIESKTKEQFALLELGIVRYHEAKGDRVPLFNVMRSLIVVGNCLIYQDRNEKNKLRYFRLDQYVVRRNPAGRPVEIVVREYILPEEIPDGVMHYQNQDLQSVDKKVELFTYCRKQGKKWFVFQEVLGQVIPGTEGDYVDENFPFLPLAWTLNPSENYGRGHVEENIGDFLSLEGLRKAFLEGSAALARLVFLLNPNGTTKKKDIVQAPNGGFAAGRKEDVSVLQAEKMGDFQFVQSEIVRLEASLSKAFLLAESVQRQAERVTAEEIRMMAADIDDTLGGIYTLLTQDLQFPLLKLRMDAMRRDKKLPGLPKEIEYTITTGFEALGRGHELVKLQQFLQMLAPLGPETIPRTVTVAEYARRVASAIGLNLEGLVPTEEEMAQLAQNQQMMGLIDKIAPIIAKVMADQMGQGQGAPAAPAEEGAL